MYVLQGFPPHLQYVAALPCEIRKSKNITDFRQICSRLIDQVWKVDYKIWRKGNIATRRMCA